MSTESNKVVIIEELNDFLLSKKCSMYYASNGGVSLQDQNGQSKHFENIDLLIEYVQ